ncbi:MAG: protein YgfX [Burkholderiales bacterium]
MLKLSIRRSRSLAWLLLAAHVAALALLWPLAVPPWLKVLAALALVASLLFFLARVAWLGTPQAVTAIEIGDDDAIAVRTRDGAWHSCRLARDSFVSAQLTIVVLRQENRRGAKHIVLVPDNVDAGDFRRLRVWLRWAGKRATETV